MNYFNFSSFDLLISANIILIYRLLIFICMLTIISQLFFLHFVCKKKAVGNIFKKHHDVTSWCIMIYHDVFHHDTSWCKISKPYLEGSSDSWNFTCYRWHRHRRHRQTAYNKDFLQKRLKKREWENFSEIFLKTLENCKVILRMRTIHKWRHVKKWS